MSDLKPCPFCGGEVKVDGGPDKSIFCIRCRTFNFFDNDTERMIRKWNTRHYPPEVEKAVERRKPKKVLCKTVTDCGFVYTEYRCPACKEFLCSELPFCLNDRCGQALDWSDDVR